MAFKDKLKDIFKPNWEAEPKNTSGASAGNSPTVQPAAATSSSDWNFDSLFTKSDGTPSSGTASGFKSLDSIFQPKDQADVPEWKPEFDSQGFYKPTGKLSSRAYQRDIAAGNNYDAMGQRDKSFFSTYYQTLDNHTKLYTDLEDLTWGNTAENGKAFKSQYAEGLKSLRDELDTVGRQYGTNSDEYRALAQFKDDYFNLGRQISANYVDKDRRAMSQNLDDTIDTVLSGVVQAPDYQEKVEAGRKAIESNPTVYHRYKLGLEGASDKQRDLMYYIYANEGDKGAREFFDRVMGDTINYQKAAKDFTKDITTNDTKAARFWEANKANFAAAIDGQFGTGVRQLFTNTKADPDNRTIIKGYEISDSVDDFLRQQIALDEEELAIYGDDAFARLSSEVSADWVKEAAKDASDYQKGVLGYLYLAYKNPEASEALWEEIKGLDDEIWQMVNPGTVATAASSIEGGLYRDYLGLGSHKAPSWMGNPGEGEDKEDLAVAQAIWDFALTTRAQYPQMAGNILGALAGGPLVGQVLGSAIMSTSVYGNSYKESIEQGYSPKQAAAYGVSQAMSEFGTDMLLSGIAPYAGALTGNVGRTIVRRISNPFLQAVANLGIRSMGEGLQEYVQDIIDVPIRNIIFQENNKLNLADPGAVYSFFLGAMSAAAMSAPNIRSETNINKLHVQFGRALTKLDSTQKLVDTIINSKPAEGLTKEQRESYDKAVSIAKDLKAGRVNPNNRLVGEMFTNAGEGKIDLSWLENPTTVDYNKDALTVEDMAAGARARLAELHGNVDLAQDLARYATGEQVTAEFMQALKDDPIAAQVFSELTGELDMENDKNALTIAARSTTRNNTGNKDYDTLKAENTTQTVASPAAATLFKAGVEFEEAQQIGAVVEKVANGQTITEDEAELIPVGNSAMRQILSDTLGITIAEDATIGTVLQEMNNAAATMAETRSMQQEVANTAKQAAQARMPIPPNQQVDTTGTISIAGVEMNHDQFIENFMQKPGATLEQAEKAWANGRTVSAALNGEESTNGRRSPIPSNPERWNESLAAGGTVQESPQRGAEAGGAVDTGAGREGGESQATGEELKRQLGYDPKHRVKRFNADQRKFLLFCRELGFDSIVLVKGALRNAKGQPINAKFDPETRQLTIRWDNPWKDINSVAKHEAVHLWLTETFGESVARYEYVNNALKNIFGEDTAAYDEMVKKYVEAYKKAYSGLDEATYLNYVNEEILADMYGGMENYGAKAGQYQQQAQEYLEQTNLRGEETETEPSERLSLDDPFRNDVDLSIPAEVRPYPGEPDAHPDLSMFSLTGMAEGGNFELQLNTAGQPYALVDKRTGKRVEHVTSEMMVDTPLGNIVNMALEGGNITAAQAAQQYQMLADAMNLIVDYKDAALVWELVGSQMFSAVKANSDKQYNKTIDFSTICKKTMAIVDAMSETMKKLGRGLTRREVEIVYEETGKKGLATPCPVCYVFSRWMGIGGLLDQMNRFQNTYANKSEEELVAFMKDIEDQARAYAAADPKGKYHDKNGNFLIGKVISDMKSKPNNRAASAMETLNQHQQAKATIAELERAKQGADPATVKRYNDLIKKLRGYIKSEKGLADAEAKMQAAEAEVEPFEVYQWLAKTVMISDSSEVNEDGEAVGGWRKNPNFKPVPKDILFDLNKGGEFAHDYPLSWAFRTGKGCAAGKAIAPYSDARVGETIQGVALSDVKDIRIGDTNEFKNGDIKKQQQTLKSASKKQRRQNLIGGMRYQSTSDFRYEFGSDYLMTFLEMQAIGANVQLYTKVIEAVDFLASTGADCNLSVMPLGDGYVIDPKTGKKKLAFSNITGINADAAIRKSKQYDNVQLILVGINDENIRLALEGTDVTFVIPFHGSGQSVHQVQTLMDLLGEQLDVTKAQDYTSVQTDRAIKNRETEHPELQAMWDLRMDIIKGTFLTQDQKDALKAWNEATTEEEKTAWANRLSELGKMKAGLSAEQKARLNQNKHLAKLYDLFYVDTTDPAFYNNLANDQAEQIFPYEYWDKSLDYDHADENGRIFQEYCASIGVIPRFSGINAKYEKTGFGDFTQDKGYWKLLIDRPMYKNVYDENGEWIGYGEYRAQQQINMTNIDIGDLNPETGKAQFQNGEMSKQYDATHNAEDLATRDNIVSDSIKRIEAMRGSDDVVERNALDRTRVKKDFRPKIMEAQSALREANQTAEPESEVVELLSLADGEPKEETVVYIKDGYNKETGEAVDFINEILEGRKHGETRNHNRFPYKNWVGLAKGKADGKVYGRVKFGKPYQITRESPEYQEAMIAGTNYDIPEGGSKWYYPVLEIEDFRDDPKPFRPIAQTGKYQRFSLADLTNEENSGTIDTNQNQGSEANATEEDETRRRERRVHRLVKQLSSQNWTGSYFQGVRDQVEGLRPDRAWCTTEPKARRLTDVAAKFFLEEGHEFAGETLLQTNDAINYGVQDFLGWFFDTMYHTSPEEFTEMLMDKIEDADVLLRRMQKETAVKDEAEFPENFAPTEADARYMKAIKDGDIATLQDMVRDAAHRAGYNMELYQHSAGRRRFEAFDRGEFGFHLGSWAQAAHIVSQGRNRTYDPDIILPFYVSINNPTSEITDLGDWQVDSVAGELLYGVDEGWQDDLLPYRDELDKIASDRRYSTNHYGSWQREQLTDILEKAGLDAIAYENSYEDSEYQREGAESYIIWKPTQMKSADLITYDQDGKVIPLSQRFDPSKPEYRYSLALDDPGFETSNNEAPVTDERGQVLYVAPSSDAWTVARDTDGSLLNTEYIQNELGLPIYDNPHDAYAPEERGSAGSGVGHLTANPSTIPTYRQAFQYLKNTHDNFRDLRVLDASSGQGFGTAYGRNPAAAGKEAQAEYETLVDKRKRNTLQGKKTPEADIKREAALKKLVDEIKNLTGDFDTSDVSFNVTDLEPYHGPGHSVDYEKYGGLIAAIESGQEEPFDFIISNAVINVMAQDAREELLANLIRMLKQPGGQLFINPAFAKEWDGYKKAIPLEEYKRRVANGEDVSKTNVVMSPSTKTTGGEIYTAQSKSIQKGYTDPEFMAFAKDVAKQALGEDIQIEKGSKLPGLNKGFVITRSESAQPTERYSMADPETQQKNREFNEKQTEVGTKLVTLNGSPIQRYGTNKNRPTGIAGKEVSPQIYVHKDYAAQVIPEDVLSRAEKTLATEYPGFEYNTLMYDKKTGAVRFDQAPNFDTAREPIPGRMVTVKADGTTTPDYGDYIWHHKWEWVGNDYKGFDVADSWNWSKQWLNQLRDVPESEHKFKSKASQRSVANGTGHGPAGWNEQLAYYGLPSDPASEIEIKNKKDEIAAIKALKKTPSSTGQPLFSMAEEQDTDERYSVNKKNPFPEGSAEQQMLDILTNANKAEDLQEYINKLIEKRNESIARSNYTPPALPQNTLFPVNAKQKQAGTNQLQKMIDKYGALKKGEKPARDKNYPERTSDSRFTRRTARTAAEAASIPEYFADQIDQAVLSELLTYARITDQAALKVGDGDYNRLGYKNAIKEWNENRANTNRPSKYDIAFGERILVEAASNNDAAVAMKVLADLAAMATQSGQVVQAIRMLKDMGPVGQLYYIQKAVDRINKDNAGRIAKGTFPPITIDQAKAEAVILSNTKKEMDENMKVLIQSIADQIPVNLKDKWDAWRYFAMLGNIRTHGRNVLGNAIFAPVRFAKDLLAAAGESAFIKDPNERTKNAAAALKSQKYQDLRAFALEDFENMQQYIITGSKMNPLNEIMEARKIFNKGVVGKNFEKLRRWNDNMLNKEDIIFLRKAYVNAFTQFVAARGLTAAQLNGPKGGAVINEARQYAALEAQKATYRDFSRLASALNHLRRNSGMGLLLDGLLPFTKTPINILRRGVEYSPVGLMKGTFDALVKVRRGDITAAQAIDEMAAGLTGTGVAILGYILASMGLARGADDDDDKKKALEEAEGHQKYSLEIPGVGSYTIDWMAPVALPFFVGVEAHKQLVGDGEGTFWDFCDAMTLLCEPMMSLSMLDGINSTLSAVKSSQNNAIWAVISNILASYVSQGAPTIAGQVARTFDPDRRSTYIDKNIEGPALLQRTIQGIQGKTPWANKKMAYVDVWGRKDTNSSFLLRAAENLALPGYGNRINETPVDTELLRLYDSIGDNDVLPDTVAKYFQVEGERLNLTAKQYEQYKTVTGQTAFKMIGDLIDDPIYGKMDDTEKAAVVKSLLSAATAIGKKAVAPTYKMENWVDHAVAQDNLETAAIYRTLKAANTGLSNYQLISAMDWLTPEDRGKLIMEEHSNVDRAMTDPRRKKHKFILTDEQIAREREIYNSLFWPAYNELIYSQKFMSADIANRANMISSMQTALGKQSRTQLSDELTAAGYTSAVQDDSDVPEQVTSLYDLLNRG